jgi:hypothetical protein
MMTMKLRTRTAPVGQDASASRDVALEPAVRPPSALTLIDDALREFASRHLVTGTEIVDVLLDLRSAIEFDRSFAVLVVPNEDR